MFEELFGLLDIADKRVKTGENIHLTQPPADFKDPFGNPLMDMLRKMGQGAATGLENAPKPQAESPAGRGSGVGGSHTVVKNNFLAPEFAVLGNLMGRR